MSRDDSHSSGLGGLVLGVGVDLVDIRRIEKALARFEERFTQRIYTAEERAICDRRGRTRAESYARRWAAKEAAAKALGTGLIGGLGMGVGWQEIEILRGENGRPFTRLSGETAAHALQQAVEAGRKLGLSEAALARASVSLHVSMTDEPPYAAATATLQAVFAAAQDRAAS